MASLLLGLYDGAALDHVGFVGSMSAQERERATEFLEPIVEPPGFTGVAPGGPSRWRKGDAESEWFPVRAVGRGRGVVRSRYRPAFPARQPASALASR